MSWTRLGAELPGDAEPLSDAAFRTHVEALIWSSTRLLDLLVPHRHLSRFAYCKDPEAAAAELVAAGWWETRGDAWYVGLRYPEWQLTAKVAEAMRSSNAERQAAWRQRQRLHKAGDHSECVPSNCPETRNALRDAQRNGGPIRSDPYRPEGSGYGSESAPPVTRYVTGTGKAPTPDQRARKWLDQLDEQARDDQRERVIAAMEDRGALPPDWREAPPMVARTYESHILAAVLADARECSRPAGEVA